MTAKLCEMNTAQGNADLKTELQDCMCNTETKSLQKKQSTLSTLKISYSLSHSTC